MKLPKIIQGLREEKEKHAHLCLKIRVETHETSALRIFGCIQSIFWLDKKERGGI